MIWSLSMDVASYVSSLNPLDLSSCLVPEVIRSPIDFVEEDEVREGKIPSSRIT